MFCSTIIPTVGRGSLAQSVASVLEQACPAEFEVIVVNDSGRPLAPAGWQASPRVRVLETAGRERSAARNAGAAVARGAYLHFLDDDDYLLPGALNALWGVRQAGAAPWLYGAAQLVDQQGRVLYQFRPDLRGNSLAPILTGEWLPLGASLLEARAFFGVGGFDSRLASIAEDTDLMKRFALHHPLAGTTEPVVCIRRGQWQSTSDWARSQAAAWWSREKVLGEAGVLARLHGSAADAYWRGRVLRAYLISLGWNARRLRLFTAFSRGSALLAWLLLSGWRVLSPRFWRGLARAHATTGFVPG